MYVRNQALDSTKIFDAVKPTLEWYFDSKIYSTESQDCQISTLLDCCCGIDAIVATQNETVFGIAHRVSRSYYETFTIRTHNTIGKHTEIDHMRQDGIKPRYTVQTVCKNGTPVKIAIARSLDLLYAIDNGLATIKTTYDGNQFAVLDWKKLIDYGINVDIIKL